MRRLPTAILAASLFFAPAGAAPPPGGYSRFLLGAYRKTMLIEGEIGAACEKYGVPVPLARAVCMYESGGNDGLTSAAGAHGYFQVMPSTMKLLGVDSNIEAGVKYLGQMIVQFGREDDALAAYNAGPGRVARGSPMPIETLQYVLGIGYLRTLLVLEEPAIRAAASRIRLREIAPGESWADLARATGTSLLELRLYNTYQVQRPLRPGHFVAYPPAEESASTPGAPVLTRDEERGCWLYTTIPGDLYLHLAFSMDVTLDRIRADNALWRVQPPIAGMTLCIRPAGPAPGSPTVPRIVVQGETVESIAASAGVEPWVLMRDNGLWDGGVQPGQMLMVSPPVETPPVAAATPAPPPAPAAPPEPRWATHTVRRGETLHRIATAYGTTVSALREVNGLKSTKVKTGQKLKVPAPKTDAPAASG